MIIICFSILTVWSQEYKKVDNFAFKRGEKFVFRVYYESIMTGKVTAGEATLEVTSDEKIIGGRRTYHVVGYGKSKGLFNMFFKVVDRFESYFDEETLMPWLFIRRTKEGGYIKDDDVTFIHNKKIAVSRTATKPIPDGVHDFLSAFYWARNININKYSNGESAFFNFFLDDTTYQSKLVFVGKETIKTSLGKFKTIKIKPGVAQGNVFNNEHPIELWVTDDKNRIPLIAQSQVIVGKVKMELISYSGLANPITAKLE